MGLLKRFHALDLLFFAIPFCAGSVYLLSFYPGILTFDSIYQWDQVSRFAFTNWHPAYHTILIWLISRIYYSPAAFALFQILLFSGVMAYGLRALKDWSVPTALLILLDIGISILPVNGMMEITLWKDVLYSICVLLLTIYLLKIVLTKGDWLTCGGNWICLGLVIANVTLLRHNGFPVAFGTLVAVLLAFARRKQVLFALAFSLLYIGMITGPVYKIFKVDLTYSQGLGVALVHPIAAYVHSGTAFSSAETAYLNRIFPMEKTWPYNCYDATFLFYQGVNFRPVIDEPIIAAQLLGRLTLTSPQVLVDHFTCLSSFVWQLSQPKNIYLETIITKGQSLEPYPQWQRYGPVINPDSKLPELQNIIIKAIKKYYRIDTGMIFMRPAIYLYLLIAGVLLYAWRAKNSGYLLLLIPGLIQTLVIAFTAQLQALRYQYPVYLISMLFTIPLLYLAIVKIPSPSTVPVPRPAGLDQ